MDLAIFFAASKAVMKTCTVVLLGAGGVKQLGIAKTSISDLGKMTVNMMLPCLTCASLGRAITYTSLESAWITGVRRVRVRVGRVQG